MNVVTVGYRYTRDELSTLLQALRISGLPGAPLNPVEPGVSGPILRRLCDEGLAIMADGTLYVDRVMDFLLRSARDAKSAVAVTDGSRTAVLWAPERLYILGDFPEQGECALTPLKDLEEAQGALADAIGRMTRPLWGVNVFEPNRRAAIAANSMLSDQDAVLSMTGLL